MLYNTGSEWEVSALCTIATHAAEAGISPHKHSSQKATPLSALDPGLAGKLM